MTKVERKALQNFVNQYGEFNKKRDDAFEFLKEANRTEGTGTAWCSAEHNYKDLLSCGRDYTYKYELYVSYGAKVSLMQALMGELAELNFWKS